MRARSVSWLFLAAALVACEKPTRAPAPDAAAGLEPIEVLRARLAQARAIAPDRRFLSAVVELHHVLTGWNREPAFVERSTSGFEVQHYAAPVGALPARADLSDAKRLLSAYLTKIGKAPALEGPKARGGLDLLLEDEALSTLARVQAGWAHPTREALHDATRALVSLAVLSPDDLGDADGIAGRALAALVIDETLGGVDVRREEALLAWSMGYAAHAAKVSSTLPDDDPVRAFLALDDERLERSANGGGGRLARFLFARRLDVRGDHAAAAAARRRWFPGHLVDPGFLLARLDGAGDPDGRVARALFASALLDVTADAGAVVAGKARADLIALAREADPDPARVSTIVHGWLAIQRVEGLARFEQDLPRVGDHDVGPFFDRGARRDLLRARATTSLHREGLALARTLVPDAASKAFAVAIGSETGALAKAFGTWHRALVDARRGAAVEGPLATLEPLGPIAAAERVLAITSAIGASSTELRDEAKRAVAGLDGRPDRRARIARIARAVLLDDALERDVLRELEALAPARDLDALVRLAAIEGPKGGARLDVLRGPIAPPSERIGLLARAERDLGVDREADVAAIAGDPASDDTRRASIERLEDKGKLEPARAAAEAWLEAAGKRPGPPGASLLETVARLRAKTTDAQGAWTLLEPHLARLPGLRVRAAIVLASLGRRNEAEPMVRGAAADLPPLDAAAALVEVLLRAGDAAAAVAALDAVSSAGANALEASVGEAFARAAVLSEGGRDPKPIVSALHQASTPIATRRAVARAILRAGDLALAAAILDGAAEDAHGPIARLALRAEAARARGEKTLTVEPSLRPVFAPVAHEHGLAAPPLVAPAGYGAMGELAWVLAATRPEVLADDAARAPFRAHFANAKAYAPGAITARIGRFLAGLDDEAALRAVATTAKTRCEVAYYLALRADADRRDADARTWLQVALDEGTPSIAEWRWAAARAAR